MARAALGEQFRAERKKKGFPDYCQDCHAPTAGAGLVCSDCHGAGGHPYPKTSVPAVCVRCHDAAGESTVRRFRESAAARQGDDCLDCHLSGTGPAVDHRFEGPSVAGFLDGIARVRLVLREGRRGRRTLVVRTTHRAGHALPGGTTGRSVWLVVTGLRANGAEVWREEVRFGWEHHGDKGWRDRTLPPGEPAILELPNPGRNGATRLHVGLYYRFTPGPLNTPDPKMVTLDETELALPMEPR